MIRRVGEGGGVVCVNFYSHSLDAGYSEARRRIRAANPEHFAEIDRAELGYTEQGPAYRAIAWQLEPGLEVPDIATIADHIMHIVAIAGPQAACRGSDFDGVSELPLGLESVASLLELSVAFQERGMRDETLRLVLRGNILRILGTSD